MTPSETPNPGSQSLVAAWAWELPANPEELGFTSTRSGALLSRSIMLEELTQVVAETTPAATLKELEKSIVEENLLGKVTFSSRQKSFRHLVELYSLDNQTTLFRLLRKLCQEDPSSLPQLAIVCAFCRDLQLRESFRLIEKTRPEVTLPREEMEAHLEAMFPGRYSPAMKKSLAQNVNTSWRDSGHLAGRAKKHRTLPKPNLCGTVYAMLAGYLMGHRGNILTGGVFAHLVGADSSQAITLLQAGAVRGWCKVRHGGDVLQIDFSPLLTSRELELVHGAA